jgi:hypothetical protein
MPKHKEQTIPVTLHLTPEQVEALIRQVTGAEEDWMDDPRILRMLVERDRQVASELRVGKVTMSAGASASDDGFTILGPRHLLIYPLKYHNSDPYENQRERSTGSHHD